MAVRFHRGGRLLAFGSAAAAASAAHLAADLVHPTSGAQRPLPALALTGELSGPGDPFAHHVRVLAAGTDIALAMSADGQCPDVLRALLAAKQRGLLTVALVGGDGGEIAWSHAVDYAFVVHSDRPTVVREIHLACGHLIGELLQTFLDYPELLVDTSSQHGGTG